MAKIDGDTVVAVTPKQVVIMNKCFNERKKLRADNRLLKEEISYLDSVNALHSVVEENYKECLKLERDRLARQQALNEGISLTLQKEKRKKAFLYGITGVVAGVIAGLLIGR